ncbi:MAG: hypothetical protein U0835_06605 [Isosphaeraceae bacterium]
MSIQSPPTNLPKPRPADRPRGSGSAGTPLWPWVFDLLLLCLFLSLTFLLGMFPLKDTDFWWHLRAGDMIRQSGSVPKVDPFTYGAEGKPWIDLHWVYQVGISLVFERGGVPALTLAKCVITTAAVLLLVTARRREWPLGVMLLAWLPALLVLGGRMYVRPETLTLLYLSIFLAVLTRVDRFPWLALALPVVQAAWVNTQGLFVFGPILFAFALLDSALRPGSFAPGRKRWWRIVGIAALLTGAACLLNPYGLTGALYPLQLAQTMRSPVFSRSIAELMPVPTFIARHGLSSLPLRLQFVTMGLGALSFLAPMTWVAFTRIRSGPTPPPPAAKGAGGKGAKAAKKGTKAAKLAAAVEPAWRLSPFRLLLFAAFSFLSIQATRNSHQFAAAVGAVTAWNLGEWAAAMRRRREQATAEPARVGAGLTPRLVALAALSGVVAWVGTGAFYEASGEGRVIGVGEQPLWFPHEAVKFAGGEGMPPRFLGFHIGHASLYDYYHGPEKKVYVDARLEVIGADLFERYTELERRIGLNEPGWERDLESVGRPVVLADHEMNAAVAASLLTSQDWKCVWFDPVAVVFVHAANDEVVRKHAVDFAGRHFRPDPATRPRGSAELFASARGLRNIASLMMKNGAGRTRGLVLLGQGYASQAVAADPSSADAWKMLGQLELFREVPSETPIPRFRLAFDPVFDLTAVRSTYALKRAAELAPEDFTTLLMLSKSYEGRAMSEAALPVLDRLCGLTGVNPHQFEALAQAEAARAAVRASLGPPPPQSWSNLNELRQIVSDLLARGRAETAAEFLERASPDASRPWDETDRIATLRLHLGEPAAARRLWLAAPNPPKPALRQARVALTYLVEGDFDRARTAYREAAASDPTLFEAHYGLAVLEQDAGRAAESLKAARQAVSTAPTDFARSVASDVLATVTPYATTAIAAEQ